MSQAPPVAPEGEASALTPQPPIPQPPVPPDEPATVLNTPASTFRSHFKMFWRRRMERIQMFWRRTLTKFRLSNSNPDVDDIVDVSTLLETGATCRELYRETGEIDHLNTAIQSYRLVMEHTPIDHPSRDARLNNIGSSLSARFIRLGDEEDLTEAIQSHRQALELRPLGHPARPTSLTNTAHCLSTRYTHLGDVADLEEAIRLLQESLSLSPPGHRARSSTLNNLATCFSHRYNRFGDTFDLSECIRLHQEALTLRPPGHPARAATLNNLGLSLSTRYEQMGEASDLAEAIQLLREGLGLYPSEHPMRDTHLGNLAMCVSKHYEREGDLESLDECIRLHEESLALRPPGHSRRDVSLTNLAACLAMRYDRIGDKADLARSIQLLEESLELCPQDHPARDTVLNNLGLRLSTKYKRTGEVADLTQAMRLHQQALELRPLGHPNRSTTLNNFALCLMTRHDRTSAGDLSDLNEAIRLHRECLKLRSPGHPARDTSLSNLAAGLSMRFVWVGDPVDLTEAVASLRESLQLRGEGHPMREACLNNLAMCLSTRYDRFGDIADLDEAISLGRENLRLCLPGHPSRDANAHNLATFLSKRYDQTKDIAALDEAFQLHQEALEQRPPGHPNRSQSLTSFVKCLVSLSDHYSVRASLLQPEASIAEAPPVEGPATEDQNHNTDITKQVFAMIREATMHSASVISYRIDAANAWRELAHQYSHPSELDAARATLNLLDQAVSESTSVEALSTLLSREKKFRHGRGVASDAAALAIQAGDVMLAVSLLEQGRSTIFSQLGRYRSAIDDVREASPGLATRFVELSAELNALVLDTRGDGTESNNTPKRFEDITSRHQEAHTAWTSTVDEIRRLPGLETFLLPPSFDRLQRAAEHGPVVIVNINTRRSDAIIILRTGLPLLVPLPDADLGTVLKLSDRLGERPADCEIRVAKPMLRQLWSIIVAPVVERLQNLPTRLPEQSRIWWCPTGPASKLPLHAAGPYRKGENNLPHLFLSSYIPTLGALIRARQPRLANQVTNPPVKSLLVVGQADTPGEKELPRVIDEVRAIQGCAPHASTLQSSAGTKDAVLSGIQTHNWLHLACHGHHNPNQPFHSYFALHDGPIRLLDLIQKDIPHAELAVLSACHSARVNESLPDEVLHPAAGMMFAGYKSVVGTMWAFDDGFGSALAGRFYELMFEDGRDHSDAAAVLANVVQELTKKDKTAIPFMQRINVVHYGV